MKKALSIILSIALFVAFTNFGSSVSAVINFVKETEGVTFDDTALYSENHYSVPEHYNYTVNDDKVTITGYTGQYANILIPSMIDGKPVTMIYTGAFRNNQVIESVIVPDGITQIGDSAFMYCNNLKNIELPESLQYIGNETFHSCKSLSSINLPNRITGLGLYDFYKCTSLKSIQLPTNLNYIGSFCFSESGIESIVIPDGVGKLERGTFYKCISLKNVILPDNLVSINSNYSNEPLGAFEGCSNLESITVPASLKNVSFGSFSGCRNLKRVYIDDLAAWFKISFETLSYYTGSSGYNEYIYGQIDTATNPLAGGALLYLDEVPLYNIEIPDGITVINNHSLVGCGMESVTIPDSVKTIGGGAFQDCKNLIAVTLPDSVTLNRLSYTFGPGERYISSFQGAQNAVFYCNKNSNSAKYAYDSGFPVIDIKTIGNDPNSNLIYEDCNYICTTEGNTASGYLPLSLSYAFKEEIEPENMSLKLNIPSCVTLVSNSITLDGLYISNYDFDDNILTIPLTEKSGRIKMNVKQELYKDIYSAARITYTVDGKKMTEVVGLIYSSMPAVTLNCTNAVSDSFVNVSGITHPEQQVYLFVDGVPVTAVTANKLGEYSARVDIFDVENDRIYEITAQVETDEQLSTASAKVKYIENIPEVQEIIMYHDGQVTDLTSTGDTRPIVIYDENEDFTFKIKIKNDETVSRVLVSSTRNNVKKTIQADWNEKEQLYIAKGVFGDGSGTIPGDIDVEVIHSSADIDFDDEQRYQKFIDEVETYYEENIDTAPEYEVKPVSNSGNKQSFDIILPPDNGDGAGSSDNDVAGGINESKVIRVEIDKSADYKSAGGETAREMGYFPVKDKNGDVKYAQVLTDTGNDSMTLRIVEDIFEPGSCIEMTFNSLETFAEFLGKNGTFFKGVMSKAGAVAGLINTGMDVFDFETMRSAINSSNVFNSEDREQLNNEITCMEASYLMLAFSFMTIGAGFGSLVGGPIGSVVGLVLGFAASWGTAFFKNSMDDTINHSVKKKGGIINIQTPPLRYGIDPSGYVYDITTNERLQGVTATVYCIEYNPTDANFWENKPSEDEYGTKWDSTEWGQLNPLVTDAQGRYSWDVPEGWWRVRFQKEGYVTAWSDWVPVPPVQTEVNVGLMPVTESVLYDFNNDGHITAEDVRILMNAMFEVNTLYDTVKDADFDKNGKITLYDVNNFMRVIKETALAD